LPIISRALGSPGTGQEAFRPPETRTGGCGWLTERIPALHEPFYHGSLRPADALTDLADLRPRDSRRQYQLLVVIAMEVVGAGIIAFGVLLATTGNTSRGSPTIIFGALFIIAAGVLALRIRQRKPV